MAARSAKIVVKKSAGRWTVSTARMGRSYRPDLHVIPSKDGWSVSRDGAVRATRRFSTESEAIAYAQKSAKAHGTGLVVHGRDGRIRSLVTYAPETPAAKAEG